MRRPRAIRLECLIWDMMPAAISRQMNQWITWRLVEDRIALPVAALVHPLAARLVRVDWPRLRNHSPSKRWVGAAWRTELTLNWQLAAQDFGPTDAPCADAALRRELLDLPARRAAAVTKWRGAEPLAFCCVSCARGAGCDCQERNSEQGTEPL